MTPDFESVTELAGEDVSREQVERVCNRYYWAGQFCAGKDILEVACGTGPGLGYLGTIARSVRASDLTPSIVARAKAHYGDRFDISVGDATATALPDQCVDVVLIFEALYYIPDPAAFAAECKRILRPGGMVLVSNANKDLFDFNPSPHSSTYHGVVEMEQLFARHGFTSRFWGGTPIGSVSLAQKILRPIKAIVVKLNLMPRTMGGKRLLKRLVFGAPVAMPTEITADMAPVEAPQPLPAGKPDMSHKVIYCQATLS